MADNPSMLRTIKVSKAATDKQLLEEYQKQFGHDSYKVVPGPTTEIIYKTEPPAGTVAVVVEISPSGGAIKIGEAADNEVVVAFVGMVGIEDSDGLVIIPWESRWRFYTIGAIALRYIVKAW